MILQILTDAREMLDHRDTERSKLVLIADAGAHQQRRRLDRPQREHNLPVSLELQHLAVT